MVRGNPDCYQLSAVGFDQVEENLLGKFAVSGGTRGQKEHGVLFPHLIVFLDLMEQIGSIGQLRFELLAYF
jgi:hypothetical protein